MSFDPFVPPPLSTPDLPGIGGHIKSELEDFEVEELPAYEPCGEGDFLYLWIEKRGLGAEYFVRQIARRLEMSTAEIGTAGLKDRHAVTRQMVSVPLRAEPLLPRLEGEGIHVLRVSRHRNKLKPGHLHGNRFRIVVRGVVPEAPERLPPLLERLRQAGIPNYYGPQRFGREGETLKLGLQLLLPTDTTAPRRPPGRFLRKLALSAVQSALFNHYLGQRWQGGLLWRVLSGDVMARWPFGGMFVAEDIEREQARFEAREIVSAGPMFGRKMFPAAGEAASREEQVLQDARLSPQAFHGFGKLLNGTRRHNLVYVPDLAGHVEAGQAVLSFTLPAGSYATVLLREITKADALEPEEAD